MSCQYSPSYVTGADQTFSTAHVATSTVTSTKTVIVPAASATASNGLLTSYKPANFSDISTLALGCPDYDGYSYCTSYWSHIQSQRFTVSCQDDYSRKSASKAIDSRGTTNPRHLEGDLGSIVAYQLADCVEACAAMNHYQGTNVCDKVVFKANFDMSSAIVPLNCWLKNSTATLTSSPLDLSSMNLLASASLQGNC